MTLDRAKRLSTMTHVTPMHVWQAERSASGAGGKLEAGDRSSIALCTPPIEPGQAVPESVAHTARSFATRSGTA